jgi:hypothetical protein
MGVSNHRLKARKVSEAAHLLNLAELSLPPDADSTFVNFKLGK